MRLWSLMQSCRWVAILPMLLLSSAYAQSEQILYDLRCENLVDPLSVDTHTPRLSWKTDYADKGNHQSAYQILAATDPTLLKEGDADLWNSEKTTSSESVLVGYKGKLTPDNRLVYWCVRVWDQNGKPSAWSKPARFGVGVSQKEWSEDDYIGFPANAGNPQSPLLRTTINVTEVGKTALLYVNSLGYHEIYINGQKVGNEVLATAVSEMDKRSLYRTYDVTPYLTAGTNDLVIWLGQGWFRPTIRWGFYVGPLVKVRLATYSDGKWENISIHNDSWQTAESGYSSLGKWTPNRFGGERINAAAVPQSMQKKDLDLLTWYPAATVQAPELNVSAQMTEGNIIVDTLKPTNVIEIADSVWVVDMGKAYTGWFEYKLPKLSPGQMVTMRYADHFHHGTTIREQMQFDTFVASGNEGDRFINKFNYHGLQYIEIKGLNTKPELKDITGYRIQTGFPQTSSFECSDSDMNAIHDMIQYTLCNLSLGGYLVDCPQLERLGYGGDGNASTETAQTMFNLAPLYANWMRAWADAIQEDGGMPHTAPEPYSAGGGPYWCGFIITASWRTYVNYADARLITEYYPTMQKWLGYVEHHMVDGLLQPWPVTEYRNWYLGDWACPKGINQTDSTSITLVNNCFVAVCYETMAKIAKVLGKDEDADRYSRQASDLRALIQQTFYSDSTGHYGTGSQIDMIYPMLAGVTPESLTKPTTDQLFITTQEQHDGHIACGLVGIPVMTEWAVINHHPDFIYGMLKKRNYPSYLYMIDNGASTTWEHWHGERSRIHNCFNGIGSWFYQAIGGIRTEENAPGYRCIRIEPQIPQGITWANTTKDTPYGPVSVNWKLSDNTLNMTVTIPSGSEGRVIIPQSNKKFTVDGKTYKNKSGEMIIGSGTYTISYSLQ